MTLGEVITYTAFLATPTVAFVLWKRGDLRPRLLRGRNPTYVPTAVWLVCTLAMYLSPMVAAGAAMGLPESILGPKPATLDANPPVRFLAITQAAAYAFGAGVGAFLLFLIAPRAGSSAGVSVRWGDFWRGGVAIGLAWPIVTTITHLSAWLEELRGGAQVAPIAHDTLTKIVGGRADPWVGLLVAAMILGVPIVEEILFRVFLQSAVLCLLGKERTWWAILITAAAFAAMHVLAVPWYALPGLFVLGVAMGAAYERTKRVGVPIVMHAVFNAANIAMAFWGPD